MKSLIKPLSKLALGAAIGYALSHHISHSSGRARKHVPLVKLRRVQLLPNLMIATKNKTWHIHHWTYLPAFYIPLLVILRPLIQKHWLHGFILGSVIHGLTFKDRFSFHRAA